MADAFLPNSYLNSCRSHAAFPSCLNEFLGLFLAGKIRAKEAGRAQAESRTPLTCDDDFMSQTSLLVEASFSNCGLEDREYLL